MSVGVILGTLGVVAVAVTLGVLADRRWGLLPRPGELARSAAPAAAKVAVDPPGTVAAAPLRLTPGRLAQALVAQRCAACKRRLEASAGEPVRYADRELQVFRMTCPGCGAARGLYVDVIGTSGA